MKGLTCWEIIQFLTEFGEAAGKTWLYCMHYVLADNSNMFIYTIHIAKVRIIQVKTLFMIDDLLKTKIYFYSPL